MLVFLPMFPSSPPFIFDFSIFFHFRFSGNMNQLSEAILGHFSFPVNYFHLLLCSSWLILLIFFKWRKIGQIVKNKELGKQEPHRRPLRLVFGNRRNCKTCLEQLAILNFHVSS